MSDLYLQTERGVPDIQIVNGAPRLTRGMRNAVYLSLFVSDWWGNSGAKAEEKYNSGIPEILATQLLNNKTRLDVIEAAKTALIWMLTSGIITQSPEVTAEIPKKGFLYLSVKLTEPQIEDPYEVAYSLNWDSQEIELQEES